MTQPAVRGQPHQFFAWRRADGTMLRETLDDGVC